MFKKKQKEELNNIYNELVYMLNNIISIDNNIIGFENEIKQVNQYIRDKRDEDSIIKSQQRTIEALTNALCDKYKHGLFVYSEDGKIPMVIRNGKPIIDKLTESFDITWNVGGFPDIRITQIAGTWVDDEN